VNWINKSVSGQAGGLLSAVMCIVQLYEFMAALCVESRLPDCFSVTDLLAGYG